MQKFARRVGLWVADLAQALQHITARLRDYTLPLVELDIAIEPADPIKPQTCNASPANPTQARRKRVLVVGLLPGQQDLITREFGRELDLRFVTSDAQVSNRAKELSHSSDAAILMTKLVSHAAEDIIKSRGGRLIRVSGGLSQLKGALTQFYCEA